jgi:hypothetical protein
MAQDWMLPERVMVVSGLEKSATMRPSPNKQAWDARPTANGAGSFLRELAKVFLVPNPSPATVGPINAIES